MRRPSKDVWDALDQPGDTPDKGETILCYVCEGKPSMMHLLVRGKNRAAGGFWAMAEYKHIGFLRQPAQSIMRDNAKWQQWCESQPEAATWPRR